VEILKMPGIMNIAKCRPRIRGVIRLLPVWRPLALPVVLLMLAVFTARSADGQSPVAALKSLSLEELSAVKVDTVYGASKHEQSVSDAPASVTIITAEEIKLYGWRTLGEALRSVSGFYVTYDRGYAYLGVRGVNRPGDFGGRTLITVDGHRSNDPIFGGSAMDTDFILDLDLIERIEVIRGPGSSLYGNNAFFGIVNIITRRGRDVQGGEVSGSAGSFDTYTGRVTY
jgi:outer membrane receptor for ferrienterochelin and colicins